MENCEKHLVADGQVDRSHKENGKVNRVRICSKCGCLFRTIEMTDDLISMEDMRRAIVMEKWRKEMNYYKDIVSRIRQIKDAVWSLRDEFEGVDLWEKEDEE